MTVDSHVARAQAQTGLVLDVKEFSMTLDESWSPYAQGEITIANPGPAGLDQLDARKSARVSITVQQDFGASDPVSDLTAAWAGKKASDITTLWAGKKVRDITAEHYQPWNSFGVRVPTTRTFDLGVRGRPLVHKDNTISLKVMSDEMLMQDYALVDLKPYTPAATSVRQLVQAVLARLGAYLEQGTADGTVNAASSTWLPGVSAWDYLAPLVQQAGLRLWCDENRRWYLTDSTLSAPGTVTLSEGVTIVDATDDVNRDGEWYDAVVITYEWTDPTTNTQQTAYDIASVPGYSRVHALSYKTPYPGPGAAGRVLARDLARGRVQEVSAVSDYTVTPTQALALNLPDTDTQSGYVSAVTWRLPDAEMSVRSRGLGAVLKTSYLAGPAGLHYLAVPAGIKYNAFDWSMVNG